MKRTAPARARTGDEGSERPTRLAGEVGAIALVTFAVLSLVALLAREGLVLRWWRDLLVALFGWGAWLIPPVLGLAAAGVWLGSLRRALAVPTAGIVAALIAVLGLLQHYLGGDPAFQDTAGGYVGRA
ncbi:MAG: hypothetical protein FJ034_04525, partial [Chloroflexi bacterium]|nr:hypothetical protein [Chloroflexota bacterium]